MPAIDLSFIVSVTEDFHRRILEPVGPLFHRWLPDGEGDALLLKTTHPAAVLKIWFERRGYVSGGFVQFDSDRREVDPSIVNRQAILDAGPLRGMLTLSDVSEQELAALEANKENDPAYIALGKRAVQIIYPPVSTFIRILRVNFGQYWLRDLESWDSTSRSIGAYCRDLLRLRWRSDSAGAWNDFRPTPPTMTFRVTAPSNAFFLQYVTKEDFHGLEAVLESGYVPDLAAETLARAHQSRYDRGLSYAFVEAVTALEIAMSGRVRNAYKSSDVVQSSMTSFFQLSVRARLAIVASLYGEIPEEDLKWAFSAIDVRNRVVHHGFDPHNTPEMRKALEALLDVTAHILSGPAFKFPVSTPANMLFPEETADGGPSLPRA